MIPIIKIVIALLLFGCILDMPYGYFQIVRFASMAGFAYIAYFNFENNKKNEALLYVLLAILFQPLIKISLGRELWNLVDVVVGGWLIISIFYKNNSKS
jgi:hypothetical protein